MPAKKGENAMELQVKRFSELSTEELYEILRLRVSVFVVEQKCPYMETDDLDQNALHVYFRDAEGIQAYLRIIDKSDTREYVTIGRVISVKRRRGIGTELVREGIRLAMEIFGADTVYIEAQVYAQPFYENLGFVRISGEFLEDGIPHVKMLWKRVESGE